MSLSSQDLEQLRKIVAIAERLLAKSESGDRASSRSSAAAAGATRRKGKELVAFKKKVMAERKRGVPVSEIARKYGITANYVYQMR